MAEGNGSKIAIGCCSAAAVVVIAAVMAGLIFGKQIFSWFKTAAAEQEAIVASLVEWEESLNGAGGDLKSISPSEIGAFKRSAQTSDAAAPGFDLETTGQLDEYVSGATEVKVWIAEASHLEMEAIIERVKEQIDSRFTTKSTSSFFLNGSGRLTYSGSPPPESGLMVNTDGWVILMQSNDKSTDLQGLLIDYAKAASDGAVSSSSSEGASSSDSDRAADAEVAPNPAPVPQ